MVINKIKDEVKDKITPVYPNVKTEFKTISGEQRVYFSTTVLIPKDEDVEETVLQDSWLFNKQDSEYYLERLVNYTHKFHARVYKILTENNATPEA